MRVHESWEIEREIKSYVDRRSLINPLLSDDKESPQLPCIDKRIYTGREPIFIIHQSSFINILTSAEV